jgi:hypothetical protein
MNRLKGRRLLSKLTVMAYCLFVLWSAAGLAMCLEENGDILVYAAPTTCCRGAECFCTNISQEPSHSHSRLQNAYVAGPVCSCLDMLLSFEALRTNRDPARHNPAEQHQQAVPIVPSTLWAPTVKPLSDHSFPRTPIAGRATTTSLSTIILLI